jgi:hypothetical protein
MEGVVVITELAQPASDKDKHSASVAGRPTENCFIVFTFGRPETGASRPYGYCGEFDVTGEAWRLFALKS